MEKSNKIQNNFSKYFFLNHFLNHFYVESKKVVVKIEMIQSYQRWMERNCYLSMIWWLRYSGDLGVDESFHDCDADGDEQPENDVVRDRFDFVDDDDDGGVVGMVVVVVVASAVAAIEVGVAFPRFCDCKQRKF